MCKISRRVLTFDLASNINVLYVLFQIQHLEYLEEDELNARSHGIVQKSKHFLSTLVVLHALNHENSNVFEENNNDPEQ